MRREMIHYNEIQGRSGSSPRAGVNLPILGKRPQKRGYPDMASPEIVEWRASGEAVLRRHARFVSLPSKSGT